MKTILLTVAVLLSLTWTCYGQSRRPDKFLIPQNYVGWIFIEYEVKNAPAAPVKDGFNVYRIHSTGRLKTSSSRPQAGWAKDEFFYVSKTGTLKALKQTGWGHGGMVWARSMSSGATTYDRNGKIIKKTPPNQTIFIGTEQQFKEAGPKPRSK